MAEILTKRGQVITVDDEDYPNLQFTSWSVTDHRYALGWDGSKLIYMHRRIMVPPDGLVVDHIDGDGLNNRRSNLRVCTQAQNMLNRAVGANSPYGMKGVSLHHSGRFCARIHAGGIKYWLGLHDTPELAGAVYALKAVELHGEYAHVA